MTAPDPREVAAKLSAPMRGVLRDLSDEHWLTCSEVASSGMALTLAAYRQPRIVERRWTSWQGDAAAGIKSGSGYEYRRNALGTAVAAHLEPRQ